jgi:hypothetical protein
MPNSAKQNVELDRQGFPSLRIQSLSSSQSRKDESGHTITSARTEKSSVSTQNASDTINKRVEMAIFMVHFGMVKYLYLIKWGLSTQH